MFDASRILDDASPASSVVVVRRPGLVTRKQAGEPIVARWKPRAGLQVPVPSYPRDFAALSIDGSDGPTLRRLLGGPGDRRWEMAAVTLDQPSVAIPLAGGTRVMRAFSEGGTVATVAVLDLIRQEVARHVPDSATIGHARFLDAVASGGVEWDLRALLEASYIEADPNWRDQVISDDRDSEPVLMVVAEERADLLNARAAAATYGVGVEHVRVSVAKDAGAFPRILGKSAARRGAVLVERGRSGELAWVADQLQRGLRDRVERTTAAGDDLREAVRYLLATTDGPSDLVEVPTCAKCQPGVAQAIEKQKLRIATASAQPGVVCVCGGRGAQNVTLTLRLAVLLVDEGSILVVGYQPNFDEIMKDMPHADIAHVQNAGDEASAAERTTLAVLLPGSKMGHAASERYLTELKKRERRVLTAGGSQMADLVRALLVESAAKRSGLLAHDPVGRQHG